MSKPIYKPSPGEFYVYIYWNPLLVSQEFPNGTPFYVGKGTGKRVWSHFRRSRNVANNDILRRLNIQEKLPIITCAYHGYDEQCAVNIETLYIGIWGRKGLDAGGLLTNTLTKGHRKPIVYKKKAWKTGASRYFSTDEIAGLRHNRFLLTTRSKRCPRSC